MNAQLTPGNVDDRKPVEELASFFQGLIFGDKGSKDMFGKLYEKGIIPFPVLDYLNASSNTFSDSGR
jgi:hypothetical protein